MNPIRLQVLGRGRIGAALGARGVEMGRVTLVTEGPDAVLIDLPAAERTRAAAAWLAQGRIVLCPPPVTLTAGEQEAAVKGGGRLITTGEIAHAPAGRRALDAIAEAAFGPMRSLYLGIRQPVGSGDVVADLLPEALDFVLAALPGPFPSVRVNAGGLFDADRDAAVVLLRHESGAVVTLDLARCLPRTIPAPGIGEVEIDAMGAQEGVRVVLGRSAVRVYGNSRVAVRPWLEGAAVEMLRALERVVDGSAEAEGLERAGRAAFVTEAVRSLL